MSKIEWTNRSTLKTSPEITHLDLFSGTGGFALGLKNAGFNITKHYFSEIDKHAIANYRYNFKSAEYVGSVTDVDGRELSRPNIITFGSPCQDFSLAGKRAGMEGDRSSLINHAIRLISECRPDVFIWENVKGAFSSNGGADFWGIVAAFANIGGYRLEWQLLNTAWLLPQNRERIYLIGHLGEGSGRSVFPFREDDSVFDKSNQPNGRRAQTQYCATAIKSSGAAKADDTYIEVPKKAGCLSAGAHSGGLHSDMQIIKVKSATAQGYETATEGDSINLQHPNSETRRGRVGKGKAQTLECSCNQAVVASVQVQRIVSIVDNSHKNEGTREYSDLCPMLNARDYKEPRMVKEVRAVSAPQNRSEKRQNGRRFKEDREPAFTLNCQHQHGVAIGTSIRRLTEIECERLQGFPDNWTKYGINEKGETIEISRTQRYKLCGNAVTASIVQMIGEPLIRDFE